MQKLTKDEYIHELESCVRSCSAIFEEYARLHEAKMTKNGDFKAQRNWTHFRMCKDALALAYAVED